ncbi:MAG: glutathione S-transferase N-terminal domain-containing protein [Gammaproteobacteria bacterium]|nr:glutathione S-transferase N-terminal domain-containing protein [Gammaproteobacteria bacterium]
MATSRPILYVFAISHYCEKARWALDYLGIDYELRFVAPGEHGQIAKKLGAPRSSVPYLLAGEQVVQGSADIIDWADAAAASSEKRLTPDEGREACEQIEQRIDAIAGVHIRRYYYSEALVDYPQTVRPIFTRDLPLLKRLLISIGWGKIREFMITAMDLGRRQGQESKDITAGELDWVDGLLADGRAHLVGDRLSRADIAVASLLAPLALPPQHPAYGTIKHPPRMAEDVAGWEQRSSIKWVRDIYARYR